MLKAVLHAAQAVGDAGKTATVADGLLHAGPRRFPGGNQGRESTGNHSCAIAWVKCNTFPRQAQGSLGAIAHAVTILPHFAAPALLSRLRLVLPDHARSQAPPGAHQHASPGRETRKGTASRSGNCPKPTRLFPVPMLEAGWLRQALLADLLPEPLSSGRWQTVRRRRRILDLLSHGPKRRSRILEQLKESWCLISSRLFPTTEGS